MTDRFEELSGNLGFALYGVGQSTVTAGTAAVSLTSQIFYTALLVLAGAAIATLMWPVIQYQPQIMSNGELFARGTVWPLWRDELRDVADTARNAFNPLICWWNAANYWGSGMAREVILPTWRECRIKPLFSAVFSLLKVVAQDLLVYLVAGRWRFGDADFSRVSPAAIAVSQEWITLYSCACSDLGDVFRVIPITTPLLALPPLWPLIAFSEQWTDPNTWRAVEYAFNAASRALRLAYELADQVLNYALGNVAPGHVFVRPDLREVVDRLVISAEALSRSSEAAYQRMWDEYVPYTLIFDDLFCTIDTVARIVLKTAALLARVAVNVDRVVQYPGDPYWESVCKADLVEIINFWGPPTAFPPLAVPIGSLPTRYTMTNIYLNPLEPATPAGTPNPLYGKKRLGECLCTLITRVICDPEAQGGICFATNTQNLLLGFDFCCIVEGASVVVADVLAGSLEATYHFAKGGDDFFISLDAQPFTRIWMDNLTTLVRCLLSMLRLIPSVGPAVQNLATALVDFVLHLLDLGLRVIIGLASLPYFLIVIPDVKNIVIRPNAILEDFEAIHAALISDEADSFKNSLCIIMNSGFPIPPVPCAQCNTGGFTPLPPGGARKRAPPRPEKIVRMFDPLTRKTTGPVDIFRQEWGLVGEENEAAYHITPLIYYDNHTTHPIELYNKLWVNVASLDPSVLPFRGLRDVDTFVDAKKHEMLAKWRTTQSCNHRADERRRLARSNPRLYNYHKRHGDFEEGNLECAGMLAAHPLIAPPQWNETTYLERLPYAPVVKRDSPTLGPLEPTLVDCVPIPECFDLCCLARSLLDLAVHIALMVGRFVNGLVQHNHVDQGTAQDFPYFTGEFALQNKATFDSDVISLVLKLFRPIKCVCKVLNLILPVHPSAYTQGRPDLCCFIQRAAEFLAGIIQVLVNAINALAMGDTTNYAYYRQGLFKADINVLFDIAREVARCACIFIRATWPLDFIPGYSDAVDFDICCAAEVVLYTLIEITRGIAQVIITLATITVDPSSYCYWRLDQTAEHQCGGTLDELGIIKQVERILDTFLPVHTLGNTGFMKTLPNGDKVWVADDNPTSSGGACYTFCNMDNGGNGIVPCICQLFNTLIPFRQFPDRKVNCDANPVTRNCQQLDLCCAFGKLGFFLGDLTKFTARFVAAAWQPWADGLPEFMTNYFWCYEPRRVPCPELQAPQPGACEQQQFKKIPQCAGTRPVLDTNSMVQYRCGEFTCGKFNIVIASLVDPFNGLLSKCLCELVGLLDILIALIFNQLQMIIPNAFWACCFCGGYDERTGLCNVRKVSPCDGDVWNSGRTTGSGVLPAVSYIANALLVALTRLARSFPLTCYWKPSGDQIPSIVAETWIFSFLGPTANALCIATGNLMCFMQSFFFLPNICLQAGVKFLGGIVRWVAEIVFRVVGFVEAFIQTLIEVPSTCVGPTCDQKPNSKVQQTKGVNAKRLGDMLVILLSIPSDLLIGDHTIACSTICRRTISVPQPTECECWNRSPAYAGSFWPPVYAWNVDNTTVGCPYVNPNNMTDVTHVGARFGTDYGCCRPTRAVPGTTLPDVLPQCQSPDDKDLYFTSSEDVLGRTVWSPSGYPGSCVQYAACRADALPSCADDPETPLGLSRLYTNSIDGVIMAFLRYLRCLLDHIFCTGPGNTCLAGQQQYGVIFYPAILISSIVWQILGGIIKFLASIAIFMFSLFQPPSGSVCGCYESEVEDPYGYMGTRFWRPTGALCYACRTLRMECNTPVPYNDLVSDPRFALQYRCREYCPAMQRLRNPGLTPLEAYNLCLADYANVTPDNPNWKPEEVCSGHYAFPSAVRPIDPIIQYQVSPTYPFTQASQNAPNVSTTTGPGNGFCQPLGVSSDFLGNPFSQGGSNDEGHYVPLDFCPDPSCIDPTPFATVPGYGLVSGFWPCGGGGFVFDTEYVIGNGLAPAGLITCGALTIVNNALDVWAAFTAIFTTPFFVPANEGYNPQVGRRRSVHVLNRTSDDVGEHVRAIWEYMRVPTNNATMTEEGRMATTLFTDMYYAVRRLKERPQGPVPREPRQVWSARLKASRGMTPRFDGLIVGLKTNGPSFVETIGSALWEYDTSDCYDDPIACSCRNLDMHEHCHWVEGEVVYSKRYASRLRDTGEGMTTAELTAYMCNGTFTGTTVCDNVIHQCAGMSWENLTYAEKDLWVNCLDRRIQGSRLHEASDVFPEDFMYNTHAPMKLIHNVFGQARRSIQERSRTLRRERMSVRDEFDAKFPKWGEQLYNRTLLARRILEQEHNIHPWNMMYDAIVRADEIYFKWERGYYGFLTEKASEAILSGKSILPTPQQALDDVHGSIENLKYIVWNQPYGKVVEYSGQALDIGYQLTRDALVEGPFQFMTRHYRTHTEHRERVGGARHRARMEEIWQGIYASPLYQWWNGIHTVFEGAPKVTREPRTSIFTPFLNHMKALWQQRMRTTTTPLAEGARFVGLSEILRSPRWTERKLNNWRKLGGVALRIQDIIWPGTVSEEHKKRFLYNSSCVIVDRTMDLTLRLVDYCANDALVNLREAPHELKTYFSETSLYRDDPRIHHSWRNRGRYHYVPSAPRDPNSWIRPKNIWNATRAQKTRTTTFNNAYHGPGGWNFLDWLGSTVETITGWMIGARTDTWFDALRDWILNPAVNIQDYRDGNAGLAYWIRWPFVCWSPDSTNCSLGAGFEAGILWTAVSMSVIILVGAYVFPLATLPFQVIGYGFCALIIFGGIAFHFSPACAILFPAFPTGIGVTIPECIADEAIAFVDKWITPCPVGTIIPHYMASGDTCPLDPTQAVSIISCKDVGVSDGIQNILYVGVWIVGNTFASVILHIASLTVGWVFPGIHPYLKATLDAFKDANSTNMERMTFCFFWSLPMIFVIIICFIVGGIFLQGIVSLVVPLCNGLVALLFASPAVPGGGGWFRDPRPPTIPIDSAPSPLTPEEAETYDKLQSYVRGDGSGFSRFARRIMFGAASPGSSREYPITPEKKNQ